MCIHCVRQQTHWVSQVAQQHTGVTPGSRAAYTGCPIPSRLVDIVKLHFTNKPGQRSRLSSPCLPPCMRLPHLHPQG
jgi:hypothetical protein